MKKAWMRFWCKRRGHDNIRFTRYSAICMKCGTPVYFEKLDRRWDLVEKSLNKHGRKQQRRFDRGKNC